MSLILYLQGRLILCTKVPKKCFCGVDVPFLSASGHTLVHTYRWKRGSIFVYGNSPVLWVDKVGAYTCNVTHSSGNTQTSSMLIIEQVNVYNYVYTTVDIGSTTTLSQPTASNSKVYTDGTVVTVTSINDDFLQELTDPAML